MQFSEGKKRRHPESVLPPFSLPPLAVGTCSGCGQALFKSLPGLFQSESWARASQAAAAAKWLAVFLGWLRMDKGVLGSEGVCPSPHWQDAGQLQAM